MFFLDVTERTRAQQLAELLAQVTAELTGMEALTERSFVAQALSSGTIVQATTDAAERVQAVLQLGEAADLIGELAPQGITVLPMRGRGRISGPLTLFAGPDRAPLSGADLAAAEDIAGRAGLALDNARLYTERAGLAATLQRSLLTDPPEHDHAQIVVRYVPATEAAQVGGAWYVAFLQHDGATTIVTGASSGAGPAEVLGRLDSSPQLPQIDALATAAIARFEQTPEEVQRGVTRMIWANAGHPPNCCSASTPTPPAPSRSPPSTAAPPSCSTPTASSRAATPTSTPDSTG